MIPVIALILKISENHIISLIIVQTVIFMIPVIALIFLIVSKSEKSINQLNQSPDSDLFDFGIALIFLIEFAIK